MKKSNLLSAMLLAACMTLAGPVSATGFDSSRFDIGFLDQSDYSHATTWWSWREWRWWWWHRKHQRHKPAKLSTPSMLSLTAAGLVVAIGVAGLRRK